jgi:hypothetical protein
MIKKISLTLLIATLMSMTQVYSYTISNLEIKTVQSDTNENGDLDTKGISVSPAHFHLNLKPGETKSYKINLNNDTEKNQQFTIKLYDFDMNGKGKSSFLKPGTGEYSLSKWMNVSPTFFEVNSGQKKEITFTVSVPNDETGNRAAWSIIMIEQAEPRKKLEPAKQSDATVALGVVPTFAFGVFVYQNPPTVKTDNVEMTNFKMESDRGQNTFFIEATNNGNGIAYCTSYIDMINNATGSKTRLSVKKFTIVPGLTRDFVFKLPAMVPGEYTAVGVLDYEGSEEIQAAKKQVIIK